MIADLANNNNIEYTVGRRLRACRLVPIGKQGGGVRPIAVGEAIVRIAASIALSRVLPTLLTEFAEVGQHALSPGGAENVAHRARHHHNNGYFVATLDAKNAFNCLSRVAIRSALEERPQLQALWPLFSAMYSEASLLLLADGSSLLSSMGVRQGDVLGPALFALALAAPLRRLQARHPTVTFDSYLDDITLYGTDLGELQRALFDTEQELRGVGLELNRTKCKVLAPASTSEAMCQLSAAAATALSISSAGAGPLRVLGALLGHESVVVPALVALADKQSSPGSFVSSRR
jgi:hypothetical protein